MTNTEIQRNIHTNKKIQITIWRQLRKNCSHKLEVCVAAVVVTQYEGWFNFDDGDYADAAADDDDNWTHVDWTVNVQFWRWWKFDIDPGGGGPPLVHHCTVWYMRIWGYMIYEDKKPKHYDEKDNDERKVEDKNVEFTGGLASDGQPGSSPCNSFIIINHRHQQPSSPSSSPSSSLTPTVSSNHQITSS